MKKIVGITCAVLGGIAIIGGIAGYVIIKKRRRQAKKLEYPIDLDNLIEESWKDLLD